MKHSIQRGIVSPHAREAGAVPLIGRVVRLRDAENPSLGGDGRADSPAKVAHRRRVLLIWSLILSMTTLVVIGGFMLFWLRTHGHLKSSAGKGYSDANVRIVAKFVSPGQDEALDLVKRALANRDSAAVATYFRLGGASSAEVLEFLAGGEARDGRIESYEWRSSLDVEGLQMEEVGVIFAGKEAPGERLALLTPDEQGVWKVDFESFARLSRPPWKDLLEGRADRAQVRVFVAKDAYFNGLFDDERRWVCFGMVSLESNALLPEGQELLYGYCKVGSVQEKAMKRIFESGRKHRPTLEIYRAKGANSRQFEITRVLAEDWVLTRQPFDERFQ